MDQLLKLEALCLALLTVMRDDRYNEDLRSSLRPVYDTVEEAVCRMQAEIETRVDEEKRT